MLLGKKLLVRRLYLLLILFLSLPIHQMEAQPEVVRQLEKMLARSKMMDTARVNLLIRLSDLYLNFAPDQSRAYAEQARDLANTLRYGSGLGHALYYLATFAFMKDSTQISLELSRLSLAAFESSNDSTGMCVALNSIGRGQRRLRQLDKALQTFQTSLRIAELIGRKGSEANALHNIANIYYFKNDRSRGIEYTKRSMRLRESLNDTIGMAFSLHHIGNYHLDRQEYDSSIFAFRTSLNYRKQKGDSTSSAYTLTLGCLADALDYNGQSNEAAVLMQKSVDLMKVLGDIAGLADAAERRGSVLVKTGDLTGALQHFVQAKKYFERLNDSAKIAGIQMQIGTVYLAQKNFTLALSYTQAALNYCSFHADLLFMARCYNNIGIAHKSRGELNLALKYYLKSLPIREKFGDKAGIAAVTNNIGSVYFDQEDYAQAIEYFNRSLKIREELGSQQKIADVLPNLGNAYGKIGRFDEAIHYAQLALEISRSNGLRLKMKEVLRILSDIYSWKGDFACALRYLIQSYDLKDSLLNEANNESINEMTAKYESEKKEKQIALLEKDKSLLEKDKSLKELELIKNREQLRAQELQTENMRKNALLIASEHERQLLDLNNRTTMLELKSKQLELQKSEKEKQSREKEHQASMFSLQRNSLLVAIGLLLVVGFLGVKRIQAKRVEATLRADAAEYQAKAAEAESLRVIADAERRDKERQHLFSQHLIASQEQERRRIAIDLHDGISQDVLVIQNRAAVALRRGTMDEETRRQLDEITQTARTTMEEVRKMSHSLRPAILERAGLSDTLRTVLSGIDEATDIAFDIDIDDIDGAFPRDEEINVFRMVQECVNNIMKHSQATHASVAVKRNENAVTISIRDDGKGLPPRVKEMFPNASGLGMQGIQERVTMMNGNWRIASDDGKGTSIFIQLPIQPGA